MFNFITSWDDGSKYDLRLAKLLKKYNIPATFYIPSNCELSTTEIKSLYDDGFEIGGHTETHPQDLKKLCTTDQRREILKNKLWLDVILTQDKKKSIITKFCYPRGRYNEDTIMILGRCGITEARTTVQDCIDQPIDLYRIKTSVHVYPKNERLNKLDWFEKSINLYSEAKYKENGYFHIWGHSHELEKFNLWEELEDFFKWIQNT